MRMVIPASSSNYEMMRRAIADCGCFVISSMFDPSAIARIRDRVDFVARAWDYMIKKGYTSDVKDYVDGPFQAGHLPETDIDVEETWADLATGSAFDEIATKVFGSTTRGYAVRRSTLGNKQNPLEFHQDAFFIGSEPWFNFWTPLQDCGVDAPSLEVVVRSGAPVFTHADCCQADRMRSYIERTYGLDSFWTPKLRAGDALVFTSMLFHRTQQISTNKTRYSLELRGPIKDRTLAIVNVPNEWDKIVPQLLS